VESDLRSGRLAGGALFSDGGLVGGHVFSGGGSTDVLVAEEAVFEAINPTVHGEFLAAIPRVAHDGGLANVGDLFDDVEFAELVHADLVVG